MLIAALVWLWARRRKALRVRLEAQPAIMPPLEPPALSDAAAATPALEEGAQGDDFEAFVQRQKELIKERESAAMASLKQTKMARTQVDVLTQHLVETIAADPAGSAQVLRSWLMEERRR